MIWFYFYMWFLLFNVILRCACPTTKYQKRRSFMYACVFILLCLFHFTVVHVYICSWAYMFLILISIPRFEYESLLRYKPIPTGIQIVHNKNPKYLGVWLDRSLTYKHHLDKTSKKVNSRINIIQKIVGSKWGAKTNVLRTV